VIHVSEMRELVRDNMIDEREGDHVDVRVRRRRGSL
jgi:hypothetical protein